MAVQPYIQPTSCSHKLQKIVIRGQFAPRRGRIHTFCCPRRKWWDPAWRRVLPKCGHDISDMVTSYSKITEPVATPIRDTRRLIDTDTDTDTESTMMAPQIHRFHYHYSQFNKILDGFESVERLRLAKSSRQAFPLFWLDIKLMWLRRETS